MASGKFSQPRDRKLADKNVDRISLGDISIDASWAEDYSVPKRTIPPKPASQAQPAPKPRQTTQAPMRKPVYQPINQIDYPVDEDRSAGHFFSNHRRGILFFLCSIVLLVILGIGAYLLLNSGISLPHSQDTEPTIGSITVAGVDLRGMTKTQAMAALSASVGDALEHNDMTVQVNGAQIILPAANTGITLDTAAAVDAAFSGSQDVNLKPFLHFNADFIRSTLQTQLAQAGNDFHQSSYQLEGEKPALDAANFRADAPCQTLILDTGTAGYGVDTDRLMDQILDAYSNTVFTVDGSASAADQIPSVLNLEAIYQMVSSEPSAGVYGYDFDLAEAQALLDAAAPGEALRIPMRYLEPTAAAKDAAFPDVLASAKTPHNSNENRNTNLRLLCQALNGIVLQPGEVLSYNGVLGERTAEKGYKPAPAYSGFNTVNAIGGGVCQGSSTLYYCALLADLEIVDRINHGFLSSYIDPGMDATVSWPGPDLKIRNNTGYPIKIVAEYDDSYVKMQILGTETKDYYIQMEYMMSTIYRETVYQDQPAGGGFEDGHVLEPGNDGAYVRTFRCRYDRKTNELISKELEAYSSYPANPMVVVRIVGEIPETQPSTTPSNPTEEAESQPATEATAPAETTAPTETTAPPETAPEQGSDEIVPPPPETPIEPPAPPTPVMPDE